MAVGYNAGLAALTYPARNPRTVYGCCYLEPNSSFSNNNNSNNNKHLLQSAPAEVQAPIGLHTINLLTVTKQKKKTNKKIKLHKLAKELSSYNILS